MSTTTSSPKAPRFSRRLSFDLSLDSWAVTAAVLFIVLIVAGVFPRVPW